MPKVANRIYLCRFVLYWFKKEKKEKKKYITICACEAAEMPKMKENMSITNV